MMPDSLKSFAVGLAEQLLSEDVLYSDLKSGVFLLAETEAAAACFMGHELMEALQARRAEVLLVDLGRGGPEMSLPKLVATIWTHGWHSAGSPCPERLPEAVQAQTESGAALVLLIKNIDRIAPRAESERILKALKAARDANNLKPGKHGPFLIVGAGTSSAHLTKLTRDPEEAFYGACLRAIPAATAA